MAGRVIIVCLSFLAVLAFLLLLASSDADAITFKMHYGTTLSCDGPDGLPATADDSCTPDPTYGAYGAGLTADMVYNYEIPAADPKHSNYFQLITFSVPSGWTGATDKEIPNGALMGTVDSISTLAMLGGECAIPTSVHFDMYDCTTDNFEGVNDGCPADGAAEGDHECNDNQDNDGDTKVNDGCPAVGAAEAGADCANDTDDDGDGESIVAWDEVTSGENLTYGHQYGLPAGCNKYPKHVNTILEGLKPRARYFGFTKVLGTQPPSQLNFVIFNREQLSQLGHLPESDLGDDLGTVTVVILDNPLIPAAAGAGVDELCTPLSTVTTTYGLTAGEGVLTQDVPPVPAAAGTFWTVGESCGNGVDDDGNTRVDEMCGIQRLRNPEAGSGIYGTGSHLYGAYSESYRDADGDTVPNNEDECPYTVDACANDTDDDTALEDPDDGKVNDGCAMVATNDDASDDAAFNDGCPAVGPAETACADSVDDDADTTVNDGCPQVGAGAESGVECTDPETGADCDNSADDDGDGYVNDGCPQAGSHVEGDDDGDRIDDICDPTNESCSPLECDEDDDGWRNQQDNCPLVSQTSQANDADKDDIGLECDTDDNSPDGAYLNDVVVGSICIGAVDTDGDGWCDATEDIVDAEVLSDNNDSNSVPEYYGIDAVVNAAETPPGAGPQSCSNWAYYDVTSGNPHGGVAPEIDDDGDTLSNASEPNCSCDTGADPDCDGVIAGDNCSAVANPSQRDTDGDGKGDACDPDDDADKINDNVEWAAGTDPKNVCDPRDFDLTGDNVIDILDVLTFKDPLALADRPCFPPDDYSICEATYRSDP